MVRLVDMLVSEMVKRREAEERMVAAMEMLMRWIEVMDLESDGEDKESLEVRDEGENEMDENPQ